MVRDLVFLGLVHALWIDSLIPRRLIIKTIRADLSGVAVVVDLTDAGSKVTVLLKALR